MIRPILSLSLAFSLVVGPAFGQSPVITGFLGDNARIQAEREAQFDALLNGENLRGWMQHMTTRPHNVGSPKAKENAEYIAGLFRSWGYETEIEVFHVLFPTPKMRELRVLKPVPFTAPLTEKFISEDPAILAALEAEALPPYNAYSIDGDVSGELVYVNYGLPADYEVLDRHGIDVKGKIAIARYGQSWRGIKPKVAAEKGAIGCIIFNDPGEDGFFQGDAYPTGAFKHDTGVQRGSVVDMPTRPGDPLTPNVGATKTKRRFDLDKLDTITRIPVLPISYADALPIFRAMSGPVAPKEWRGAMPVTYRLGGEGSAVVNLKLEFNWNLVPTYNVIAKMRGSTYPDQWIVRANHHDAWVIGARDPMSGLMTVLEQARAFGELAKTGWRPKRTLVFGAWDGEEPGLLGSTEWVEEHAKELDEKAVAYINTDGTSRGFLFLGGSHSLETMAGEAVGAVIDPLTGVSLSERVRSYQLVLGTPEQKSAAKDDPILRIGALGSGSDYTAFIDHLGIASFNLGFGGEAEGGEYHTCFDTFDHYTRFVDPDFAYGVALTKVAGRLTLRLADADVLPFEFTRAAKTYRRYADDLVKLADTMRTDTETLNTLIAENRFTLAADPKEKYVPPSPKDPVPHLNFAPILNALDAIDTAAERYRDALKAMQASGSGLSPDRAAALDKILYQTERSLIGKDGLPRRPWFRHLIYAPGYYTGYGVKTFPGVREGIEERAWAETEAQIAALAEALTRYAGDVEKAAGILRGK